MWTARQPAAEAALLPCPRPRSQGCCRRSPPGSPPPWRRRSPNRRPPRSTHRSRGSGSTGTRRRSRGPWGFGVSALHSLASTQGPQVADHFVGPARLDQARVGDQQWAQRAQTHRGVRRFGHRVDTEHDLRREASAAGRAGRRRRRVRIRVSAPASASHTAIALCSSFATASPRPSCAGPRKCDPDNIPGPTRRRRHRWSNMRPGGRSGRLARKLTYRPPHPPARVPPVPARSGRARPVPGRRTPRRRAGRSCRGTRSTSAPVSARSSRAPCG
jgi:hypothetical protein